MNLYVESGYIESNYTLDDVFIFWDTKIIFVPKNYLTPTANPNIFNLDTDIFRLRLKDLEDDETGMSYPDTHQHNTQVPLGGVIYARVIEIINGYTVTFENGQYSVNLFGSNNNIGDVVNVNNVSVRTNNAAGLIVDPGISESLDYGEHVIYHEGDEGSAGSSWPVGTYAQPVNNCADLQLLLTKYGRSEVVCLSNMTLTQDFNDMAFVSKTGDEQFFANGFKAHNCNFQKMIVSGDFNHSKIFASECSFYDTINIGGTIFGSIFFGDVLLSTQYQLVLNKCSSTKPSSIPVIIDMVQGVDTLFGTRGHSGPLSIINCDTELSQATLIFEAGGVVLNPTCSDGNIVMGGIVSLTDNSGSGCTVDITGVIDPDTSNNLAYNGVISIQSGTTNTGTAFPIGTNGVPVNNLSDAITIATERGVDTLHIHGDWVFYNSTFLNDFTVKGDSLQKSNFTFETGAIMLNCILKDAKVSGDISGMIGFHSCHLYNIGSTNLTPSSRDILVIDCLMDGTISLTPAYSGEVRIINCKSAIAGSLTPTFNIANSNSKVAFRDYTGGMKLTNSNQSGFTSSIDMNSGNVIIDETVSAGTIVVRGISNLSDSSTGSAIIKSTGLVEPERINTIAYNEDVHIDSGSTITGTIFPAGTQGFPVNNLADAVTIAVDRSIRNLHFLSDWTFPNGTYLDGYTLRGDGYYQTKFTCESGSIFLNCDVADATITGLETGIVGFRGCSIEDLGSIGLAPSSVAISISKCFIKGLITIPSNYSGTISVVDSWTTPDYNSNPPILDMGAANMDLQIRNLSGYIKITNCTQPTSDARIFLNSGGIILDSTITAGNFILTGVGTLSDNTTGTATVNSDALINKTIITEAVWDEPLVNHVVDGTTGRILSLTGFDGVVWLDSDIGVTGTTFPIGTRSNPSSFGADALDIALRENISEFRLDGTFTSTQSVSGYTIGGDTWLDDTLILDGTSYDYLTFRDLYLTGTPGIFGDSVQFKNCYIKDITNLAGEMIGCRIKDNISVASGQTLSGVAIVAEGDYTTIDLQGVSRTTVSLDIDSGYVMFINSVEGCLIEINMKGGEIELDSSCTGGEVYFEGIGTLYGDPIALGMTVKGNNLIDNTTISNSVWDTTLSAHTSIGSTGEALESGGGSFTGNTQEIADAVWDTILSAHTISGSAGEELASSGSFTGNTEEIAIAVWNTLTSSGNADGSFGVLLNNLINKANESQHTLNVQTEMLKNKPNNC